MSDESRDLKHRSRGVLVGRTNVRRESGQSLLEVALVTPLLLVLAIGVMDLGRYAYIGILVGNAARAGAAYGAQGLAYSADTAGIKTAADSDFKSNGQSVSVLGLTSNTSCGCDSSGTITSASCDAQTNANAGSCNTGHWVVMVSVVASGTFSPLFNYPGISNSMTISRKCTMRVVQD